MKPINPLLIAALASLLSGCSYFANKPAADTPLAAANTAYYTCGGCHGPPPVDHMNSMAPVINGQKNGYLMSALKSYRDKSRINPFMNGMAKSLTDQDIENLAEYYSTLKMAN